MTGKTHMICGTCTMLAITATHFSGLIIHDCTYLPAVGLLSVASGSYMPDIDIPRSKMGRKVRWLAQFLKHRGITHTFLIPSILAALMLSTAAGAIPVMPELILGFNIGWIAHILADMCNYKGVPVFWPVCRQHIHVASFKTGTWHEKLFIALWIGGHLLWVYFQYR